MRKHFGWLLVGMALASSGCANGPLANLQWPRWGDPGTIEAQRNNAALFDPYPDPDAGPEVVGGRPRGFQKPLAEPVRTRGLTDSWWQR